MNKENTLLDELSTAQLDARLAQELQQEAPDEETVRRILAILREREKDKPVEITPEIRQAWEKYQADSKAIAKNAAPPRKIPTWLTRAASIGIVLLLLFAALPQNAQADNFWDRVARWTSEIFEFFSPHAKEAVQEPYVFVTDHPGLQQIYDAVVEMGITEPVVPMWIPDGYELTECTIDTLLECMFVHATMKDGDKEIFIEISKYTTIIPGKYEKDDTEVKKVEIQGIKHYIMYNNSRWNVAWTKDNIEGFLTIDCQEDILYDVLRSIYGLEDQL